MPSRPFETLSMDFITGLPPSAWRGQVYDTILVIVDVFTKFTVYLPCRKTITAEEMAELCYDRVFTTYGVPQHMVSDRGSLFTSNYWSTLCFYLGAKRRLSTAFHPQTDGQTERQNQTLEHFLRCFINFQQDDWAQWIPMAQYVYNQSQHSSTGEIPAVALMGYHPELQINISKPPEHPALKATEHAKSLSEIRLKLKEHLQNACESQKRYYDSKHQQKQFQVGDWVMVNAKNLRMLRPARKLDHNYVGPFEVTAAWGKQSYKVQLPPSYRSIHPVFHVLLLEPYNTREGKLPPPGPELVDGEEEYIIEAILQRQKKRGKVEYLIRWLGWGPEDDTWEPEENLANTEVLDHFLQEEEKHQGVKRSLNKHQQQ